MSETELRDRLQAAELTPKEATILNLLANAWNEFLSLGESDTDDINEFRATIHQAQKSVALRVVRRLNPEFWNQKGGGVTEDKNTEKLLNDGIQEVTNDSQDEDTSMMRQQIEAKDKRIAGLKKELYDHQEVASAILGENRRLEKDVSILEKENARWGSDYAKLSEDRAEVLKRAERSEKELTELRERLKPIDATELARISGDSSLSWNDRAAKMNERFGVAPQPDRRTQIKQEIKRRRWKRLTVFSWNDEAMVVEFDSSDECCIRMEGGCRIIDFYIDREDAEKQAKEMFVERVFRLAENSRN